MDIVYHTQVFVSVANAGSFTEASKTLSTSPANISRAVRNLEHFLKTKLINRTTRNSSLTEAGHRYLERCVKILDAISAAQEEATANQSKPGGKLRVHAMTSIVQYFLIDAAAKYHTLFPDVQLELSLSNTVPDTTKYGYDVSIIVADSLRSQGALRQN
ncbi:MULTISPECIES: LysR family transcriptional regulator [unclassified Pseudomonas]|uniref:LysR family transcriptional regulator n=1 Tax=unclassified Pseudomonas TaxID=196821 RepID=UPI00211DB0BF|nr:MULTISPECIES: LysR family transcriptional regulator [unclassified Pseudomonas]